MGIETALIVAAIGSATASGVSAAQQIEASRANARELRKQGDETVRVAQEAAEERRRGLVRTVGAVRARAGAAGFEQSGTPTVLNVRSVTESIRERSRILSAARSERSALRSRAGDVLRAGRIGTGTSVLQSAASITSGLALGLNALQTPTTLGTAGQAAQATGSVGVFAIS